MTVQTWKITGFEGVNNQNDPSGLKQPERSELGGIGSVQLAECVNFDIDDNNALLKRSDSQPIFSAAFDDKLTQTLGGRTFVAEGNLLRYSRPFSTERDPRRSTIPYAAQIVLIQEIENGMWVSTTEKIVYHAGVNPAERGGFTMRAEYGFPAIMGTGEKVHRSKLGLQGEGFVAVFATTRGICYGDAAGQLVNLSEGVFSYRPGQRGISYIREENGIVQYQVKLINPDAEPFNQNSNQDNIVVTQY